MGISGCQPEKKESLTTEDIKFIFNELRKASIIWDGRKEVMKLARKKVLVRRAKNGNPVYKFQWQCAVCSRWFKSDKEMEVDHIEEIGGITAHTGDWNVVIDKMFPRPVHEHLQVLCIACHLRKTKQFMSAIHKYKRK